MAINARRRRQHHRHDTRHEDEALHRKRLNYRAGTKRKLLAATAATANAAYYASEMLPDIRP